MKCLICSRADVKEIDRLLSKAGLRSGVISSLAAKLGCSRQVIWKHRKVHLGMTMTRRGPRPEPRSLEEKTVALQVEAKRLQQMAEYGMAKEEFGRALQALGVRMRLLQLEGQLCGRLAGGKSAPITAANLDGALAEATAEAEGVHDPEEEARAMQEFNEVVGTE